MTNEEISRMQEIAEEKGVGLYIIEMPIRNDFEVDDFRIVETYAQQALNSRWFMPARPPQEALGRVRCFFRVMLHPNPERLLALPRLQIYLEILQQKYYGVSDWGKIFLSAWLFLEYLGAHGHALTRDDKTHGEEVLEMLKELQSKDAAVSAIYAHLGVHLNS